MLWNFLEKAELGGGSFVVVINLSLRMLIDLLVPKKMSLKVLAPKIIYAAVLVPKS